MKSHEHRALGETATAGALVALGGECTDDRLVLSYGDLIVLSGDFFAAGHLRILPDGFLCDQVQCGGQGPHRWVPADHSRDARQSVG
jgi:hypothetical protein